MIFSSLTFLLIFLPVTLLLYFIVPKIAKNFVLLLCSLIFYAWGEPIYILLMLYSILLNYACGRLMDSHEHLKKQILNGAKIDNIYNSEIVMFKIGNEIVGIYKLEDNKLKAYKMFI